MIRVLQVVNIMDRAGLESMLMNYYRCIDRNKVQFDFLTHRVCRGAFDSEIEDLGGRIYHAPRLYPYNYLSYFNFMKEFFTIHSEYRIVHSHIDTMSAFPLLSAKFNEIPVRISHSHSSKIGKDAKASIKYLAKLIVPRVANVYCACGETAGRFMYKEKPFHIIRNAVDLEKFEFSVDSRDTIRKKMGLVGKFVIGHVGRYCRIKNQFFLLRITSELLKQQSNTHLLLIGKGEDELKLRKLAANLGIEQHVHFLLDQTDVHSLYQLMDVFVMPSLFEGLPVVGIEAQANGLPCIFSDSISSEVMLTKNTHQLPINSTPIEWANMILGLDFTRSKDNSKQLSDEGYNISHASKLLQAWYLGLTESKDIL